MILTDNSSTVPYLDILIASKIVKIDTWGGITAKVGILSDLFQGNVSVEILIKEGQIWSKKSEK